MGFFEKIIPGVVGAATSFIPGVGPFLAPVAAGATSSFFGGSGSSGGGSGGYGGGGGGMMNFQLPPPNQFAMDYMKKNFFDPSDIGFTDDPSRDSFANTLLTGIDNNKLDKNQAINLLGASGVNMQDPDLLNSKAYRDLMQDTVARPEGRDMSAGFSKLLYGNEGITKQEQKDIYELARSLGKTGSTQDLSNFTTAYMAQTAKGLRNRMLSPDEQRLATQYGGAVFDDKGSMFFTPTTAQKRRGDRVNAFEDALYSA
jgi:hypothetical protein